MFRKLALSALAVAVGGSLVACGSSSETGGATGELDRTATLRYADTYGTSSFDPHKTRQTSDANLLFNVYDRLIHRNPDGTLKPGLAESWETDPTGKVMTLQIRKGVQFHDGAKLDAAAVKANLDRAKESDSITTTLVAAIDTVSVVDDFTVKLELDGPGAALPHTFTDLSGMMVSPDVLARPDAASTLATKPVGAGRYTLKAANPGARYEFEAFDNYWDPDGIRSQGFVWDVVGDAPARINAAKSGQLDIVTVAPSIITQAQNDRDLSVQLKPSLTHYILYFNQQRSEFGKAEVRQAVARAINKKAIVDAAFEGHAVAATQPFPEHYFAYNENLAKEHGYDPAEAKRLLAAAGLPNGFTFTALVMNMPEYVAMAELIQSDLAKVGIKMNMDTLPPADLSPTFNKGQGDVTISAWVGRPDPSILLSSYFLAGSPSNPSKVEADGIAAALDAANSEYVEANRGKLLGAVSKIVMDEALVVPIAFMQLGAIYNKNVIGYEPYSVGIELREAGLAGSK